MIPTTLLLALLPFVSAHFNLVYPPARGFDEKSLGNYPCGGQDNVKEPRTPFPLDGKAPIQLNMGHTDTKVEVTLALGNNPQPGDFTYVIVKTFSESGPDNFCIGTGAIQWPAGLNITDGQNATMLVQTNGDEGGNSGLYNCADITFTSAPASSSFKCENSTVTVSSVSENINANGTNVGSSGGSSGSSGGSSSASGSSTGSSAAPTGSSGAGTRNGAALGAGLIGLLAFAAL